MEFDNDRKATSIEKNSIQPRSSEAVFGLYVYDKNVVYIGGNLKPSHSGKPERKDVNKVNLEKSILHMQNFGPALGGSTLERPTGLHAAAVAAIFERLEDIRSAALRKSPLHVTRLAACRLAVRSHIYLFPSSSAALAKK